MTLENKLGLTEAAELARAEEKLSKAKAALLFEQGLLDTLPTGTFAGLAAIHQFLFEDIYPCEYLQGAIPFCVRPLSGGRLAAYRSYAARRL